MPGKIKVKVLAGRNLPVMDRASDTTDAFVEIKFGGVTHKTDVCRKSLNPHWNNTEWYRFEVDESELQDEPLQLRLMDHDTYSANDAIGKVVISLAPLLAREASNAKGTPGPAPGAVMSGWIPVFDTMHGIRGELNVIVKVDLFSDFNKYKTSSCGVQFFHCPSIPAGYRATSVHGFVEELVVNDDPEYQWIDKIRTPRASNEARQVAFIKLSNQVQRLVGLKAAELGANAVVGYQQEFDLEGEAGVVARAIGTAVSITPLPTPSQPMNIPLCSQQQLKKCLDILATDDETVTDLNEYYQTHQDELLKMITILNPKAPSLLDEPEAVDDDDDKIEQGRLSIHSYTGSMSLFQDDQIHHRSLKHLSEDQTALNKLLNKNDDSQDSDSSEGPIQKIKNLKTNFFAKKFSRRKRDKKQKQDDQVSLKSTSSDVSRISLVDIKNELKKRFKKPKIRKIFTNPDDQGVEMASILARSVIHTQTSLACIAETQDSEHSAHEMRRTSESEPNINVSDDDKQIKISIDKVKELKNEIEGKTVPDIHFSSLKNVNSEQSVPGRVRKISDSCPSSPMAGRTENLLKLPGDKGYFGSVSSALSGESSEAYSSSEEDDESSELKSDSDSENVETTASIVNSVLNHKVNPAFIAQMEKKLTTLEHVHPATGEPPVAETQLYEKEGNENKGVEHQQANMGLLQKDVTALQVEDNKHDEPQEKVENVPSTSAQDSDNKHQDKKEHNLDLKSGGLIHTAMQTMLMDRAQSVMPDTPEPIPFRTEPVFERGRRSRNTSETSESSGLVHSAMQTILMDKFRAVIPNTTEPIPIHVDESDSKSSKSHAKHGEDSGQSGGLIHSAMQTILIDKVQTVIPDTKDPVPIHFDDTDNKSETVQTEESKGLTHSAVQTMLIEKVQTVLPDTPEPIPIRLEAPKPVECVNTIKQTGSKGLLQNAIETLLIEKVQSVLPDACEPIHLSSLKSDEIEPEKTQAFDDDKNSKGLIHSAMETILIDKVQTIYPNSTDPDLIHKSDEQKTTYYSEEKLGLMQNVVKAPGNNPAQIKAANEDLKSPALVETAMKTILMDQSRSAITNASKPTNVSSDMKLKESQNTTIEEVKSKKLIRQDSIHSISEKHTKMSNEELCNTKITRPPVLQHFHPLLSGLETIPSMSESSFDRSIDGEPFETNSASVCDNSHAACDFGRSEKDRDRSEKERESPKHARAESYGGKDPVVSAQAQPQTSLNSTSTPMGIHRRSSDSDLSVTPKGGSLNTSTGNAVVGGGAILRPSMNTDNLDMLEYPFLTMTEYPPGFIVHIGGTVCARSVKLVDGGGESSARAAWWAELRTELRAHARALRCNAVIAYTDTCSICEDVCVLSASGTAAVINLDCDYNVDADVPITVSSCKNTASEQLDTCSVAHVPYSPGAGPYRAELSTCGGCRRARVPAVLLATCAKPNRLMSYKKAVTLTAVAARVRRAGPGAEPGARDISDQLPFLEYELHRLLLAKLRMQGANALFGLSTQVALGERCVVALASGVAVKLAALPDPNPPTIKATENEKEALDLQRKLWESFTVNRATNGYDIAYVEHISNGALTEAEREEPPALDLCSDKDACVLELDEAEDVSTARALCVIRSHAAAYTPALKSAIAPPHAFAQVSRGRLTLSQQGGAWSAAERHVARALDSVTYKLRRLQPAAVAASFQLELPEDEIQLVVSGTAIPLVDPSKEQVLENGNISSQGAVSATHNGTGDGDDDIFTLDEEQLVKSNQIQEAEDKTQLNGTVPTAVSLTTLSDIAGVNVARRVCALRLLFVRETTAVRELGGLSGFLHTFTCEVLAIARAYTAALGGNALTSFYIRQLMLQDNAHKNQGQCLMSVGGDIVHITY